MRVYPAIDLKDGSCVRLIQGREDKQTVYFTDPIEPARRWKAAGAEWIHMVDLNGAFTGKPVNHSIIAEVVKLGVKVQLGGGLRSIEAVQKVLDLGVARAVVGTRACQDVGFAHELAQAFGEKVAVGIDAMDGNVSVHGWTHDTGKPVLELASELEAAGIRTLIHTDIATDGMLTGPNLQATQALLETVGIDIIASGGVGSDADIEALQALAAKHPRLIGVIVGKALYEGKVTLDRLPL
ncbi:MAG: 1-(5-phosphoribosyl)-5-[(5-phosphoribosylamino)methylideneamino]imidazole-4-carboxamide isomerase [Opitutales bacterium]|nr:1-(5-phosphoribosyl)-5-[(5-phosphoribosylamino)methylideneamino]imidazole-4-carboxamide isomerase [Opitutales bacterium]